MKSFKISNVARPPAIRNFPLTTGTYLVTGATGTIGGAICKEIASDSTSVVLAGAKNLARFEASGLAVHSNIKPLLLGDREIDLPKNPFLPEIDIKGVIHCEGSYGELGELSDLNLDIWIENLSIYLRRTISLINWVKLRNQQSHIACIFLGGGGASEAYFGLSNYAVMKTALVRIVETAALENSIEKMSLNVLGPGPTNSNMVSDVLQHKEVVDKRILDASISLQLEKKNVSERVFGSINFLFSEAGRKISGKFFSAEWDDFNNLADETFDCYKLRRIIPDG